MTVVGTTVVTILVLLDYVLQWENLIMLPAGGVVTILVLLDYVLQWMNIAEIITKFVTSQSLFY